MSDAMLELAGLTKRYGETLAVDDLTLSVSEGEVCVLIGPSGCGKTTTLRMINRLIEPSAGRVLLGGVDTAGMRPEQLRRGIGYAIQSVGLFPHMTVAENIGVVPRLLGWERPRIEARAAALLELVGLEPDTYAGKHPRELSGGQAQRVGVARALAADPPVLLMDEPFGAVDPFTRERLQGEFARIQRELKKTVVLVTHDLDEAIRLADRLAIMRDGRLVQYDTPDFVLAEPADTFVREFVGADRALKRLARVPVSRVMQRDIVAVDVDRTKEEALDKMGARPDAWVVDSAGVLLGWVNRRVLIGSDDLRAALEAGPWRESAVDSEATLKEALSRTLAQGFRRLPVVDARGRLVGEVSLETFAEATSDPAEPSGEGGPG
jgi:osmoprotectant transport system ATP-binding protein